MKPGASLDHVEALEVGPLERIDAIVVRLPFVSPFGTSVHTWTCKEALLLRVEAGGIVGWGECVGGLLESILIASESAAREVPVWSGGMDETGIGRAVNIHLQTAPGFTLPDATSETRRYFHEDIVEPGVVLDAGGFIEVPSGPGIGVTVLEDRILKYRIDEERLR